MRTRVEAVLAPLFGRQDELSLLLRMASGQHPRARVVYIHGPGGIGKSALLRAIAAACTEAGRPAAVVDARRLDAPAPSAVLRALAGALGAGGADLDDDAASAAPGLADVAAAAGGAVVMLDSVGAIAPLDGWLREDLLHALASSFVILAGREPPGVEWRADPRWRSSIVPLSLRNLAPDDAGGLLRALGVPESEHPAVLAFTHGHPLALVLVADLYAQQPDLRFRPEAAVDVVAALVDRLVVEVPSPAHRAAVECLALVRATSESLLARMMEASDAHDLFAWLRGLSFVESMREGLVPAELVREVLTADLRWRNPEWYAELHRRARAAYIDRIHSTAGATQLQAVLDLVYLHRENPVVRPFFAFDGGPRLAVEAAGEHAQPPFLAALERHEGATSAELARRWLQVHPDGLRVVRDEGGPPLGFLLTVDLAQAPPDALAGDPATAAAAAVLAGTVPLRPGEVALYFRNWLAAEDHQTVSLVQSRLFVEIVRHYLVTPRLALTFFPVADPEFWAPVLAYADLQRLPEADFTVDGRTFAVFAHDWRRRPPAAWLDLLAERELLNEPTLPPAPSPPLVVLSREAFDEAVRRALEGLRRPAALSASPLLHSRLVRSRARAHDGRGDPVEALEGLLADALAALAADARTVKLHRALHHTFVQPAPSQERAAEAAGLPFSTYRRYVRDGIRRVTEALWQQELGDAW